MKKKTNNRNIFDYYVPDYCDMSAQPKYNATVPNDKKCTYSCPKFSGHYDTLKQNVKVVSKYFIYTFSPDFRSAVNVHISETSIEQEARQCYISTTIYIIIYTSNAVST